MTTQTHRDLYASQFASKAAHTLERLQAARPKADKIPFAKRLGQCDWDRDGLLDQRVLQLRALVQLAKMPGKDPITVTVGDIVNLIALGDVAEDMEAAIDEAERT
jgi:hypothetical protein